MHENIYLLYLSENSAKYMLFVMNMTRHGKCPNNSSFSMSLGSLIVGSLEQIFQKEGLRGMYRGLSPTVLALLPNWAVSSLSLRGYYLYPCLFANS